MFSKLINGKFPAYFTACILSMIIASSAQANLIRNASFENFSTQRFGQGFLPDDWITTASGGLPADTYSNDGSFGLAPSRFNNFIGVTAYDGIRWVAGWSRDRESFGQWLTSNLVAGSQYKLSGWLHQAVRGDLNYAGGYEIYLTDTPGTRLEFLGFLGSTTSVSAGWQEYSFTFTATEAMANLGLIDFGPILTANAGYAYPGLDLVSLTAISSDTGSNEVPTPSSVALLALGFLGLRFARR